MEIFAENDWERIVFLSFFLSFFLLFFTVAAKKEEVVEDKARKTGSTVRKFPSSKVLGIKGIWGE